MGRFQMRLEQSQHARHRGQNRDALAANEFDEARRGEPALEVQFGFEDGRNPQPHGLAEDMAQRKRVQNAQRMDQPLVAHVGLRAVFNGTDAGQHVAVSDHHALGLARGAGGEENLRRRFVREAGDGAHLRGGQHGRASPQMRAWESVGSGCAAASLPSRSASPTASLGLNVGGYARGKIGGSGGVQRNGQHAAQQAAVKGGDPLRAVLGPHQHAVARRRCPAPARNAAKRPASRASSPYVVTRRRLPW